MTSTCAEAGPSGTRHFAATMLVAPAASGNAGTVVIVLSGFVTFTLHRRRRRRAASRVLHRHIER